MYAFLNQSYDLLLNGSLHFFMLFFILIWLRWFIVQIITVFYTPVKKTFKTTTSVVIPVVDEPPELFRKVLASIARQRPADIIVVINGPRNEKLEEVCKKFKSVQAHWIEQPGKRNAIMHGMQFVTGEITILVDSDTLWTKGTHRELIKPFGDPLVGGVTTKQEILHSDRKLLTRFCDWMEDHRAHGTFKAMSVFGAVGCLPGRTIAFRTSIMRDVMEDFMTESFMGVHKEVSDDRSLTNLTLKRGYKTIYQESSVVLTMAPSDWKTFVRQQLRWAEGSQYNNIRMLPWMARHAWFTLFVFVTDMLVPFVLVSVLLTFITISTLGESDTLMLYTDNLLLFLALTLIGAWLSLSLRMMNHYSRKPIDIFYTLPFIAVLTFVMTPIRIVGFAKMADDLGWGTRKSAYAAGSAEPGRNGSIVQGAVYRAKG